MRHVDMGQETPWKPVSVTSVVSCFLSEQNEYYTVGADSNKNFHKSHFQT